MYAGRRKGEQVMDLLAGWRRFGCPRKREREVRGFVVPLLMTLAQEIRFCCPRPRGGKPKAVSQQKTRRDSLARSGTAECRVAALVRVEPCRRCVCDTRPWLHDESKGTGVTVAQVVECKSQKKRLQMMSRSSFLCHYLTSDLFVQVPYSRSDAYIVVLVLAQGQTIGLPCGGVN